LKLVTGQSSVIKIIVGGRRHICRKREGEINMNKKYFLALTGVMLVIGLALAGCGKGSPAVIVNVDNIAQKLAKLPGTAPDSPATVKVAATRVTGAIWNQIHIAVAEAQQYVSLDLSACTATDNTVTGLSSPTLNKMNIIRNNQYIKGIILPNTLTSIGDCAFYGCTGLTSVTIQNGVTSIVSYAVSGCTGRTSVTIPVSGTSIG
jgi:hypothetical protein